MNKLIAALALLIPVLGHAQSRVVATCDQKLAFENRSVCQSSVEMLPVPSVTNGAIAANNSSGTWVSEHREVWLRNNDSTAANYIYVSTFPLSNVTTDTGKAWPVPGGNSEDANFIMRLGSAIRLYVTRASGCGYVTAAVCK